MVMFDFIVDIFIKKKETKRNVVNPVLAVLSYIFTKLICILFLKVTNVLYLYLFSTFSLGIYPTATLLLFNLCLLFIILMFCYVD